MQPNPATQKPIDPCKVTTGEVRFSYCHLTKPHRNNQQASAEERYSVTILIPKHDLATRRRIDAAIEAAALDAVGKTWGNVRPQQIPTPMHDGDGVKQDGTPYGPECRGHWVMSVGSKNRPGIVDVSLQPILDESQVYSGMYGRVSMRFFGYFNSGKRGIGVSLNNAQKLRDGEPLATFSTPQDDFGGGAPAGINPINGQPMG